MSQDLLSSGQPMDAVRAAIRRYGSEDLELPEEDLNNFVLRMSDQFKEAVAKYNRGRADAFSAASAIGAMIVGDTRAAGKSWKFPGEGAEIAPLTVRSETDADDG